MPAQDVLVIGLGYVSLVFSPERIDPGNPEFGLVNTPKIAASAWLLLDTRGVVPAAPHVEAP